MPDTPEKTTPDPVAELAAATEPKTYEVKLSTGEIFKGESPEAVIEKMKVAQEHSHLAIRDREQQIRERDAQLQNIQRSAPVAESGTFDKQRYWKLMDENPVEAQNYLDGHRLGLPADQVAGAFQRVYTITDKIADQFEIARFHQNFPDFPGGEESADLLLRETESRGRHPGSADNLGLTFMELQREGKIKSVASNAPEAQERHAPPPSLGGGGGSPDVVLDGAELERRLYAMTPEQLEAYAVKMGAKKG